jgi:hypothetical protein
LVAHHQRVAGIVPALKAHHDVGAAGQPVHNLAFAFVTPLGADHGDICHFVNGRAQRIAERKWRSAGAAYRGGREQRN